MTIGNAVLIRSYGATGLLIALSLASSVMFARFLGPEARGLLLALMFWPYFVAASLYLSLNEATALHVARAAAGDKGAATPEEGQTLAASGLVLQSMAISLVTPITLLLLPFLLADQRDSLGLVLAYTTAYIPAMFLDLHAKAVLQGRGRIDALNVLRLVQPVLYTVSLIALWALGRFSVDTVLAAMLASTFVSAVTGLVTAWSNPFRAAWARMREIAATGAAFHVANLLVYAANEADKLIVLGLLNLREIGYYSVALAISALGTNFIIQSLGVTVTSEMAAAATREKRLRVVQSTINDGALLLAITNGPAALLMPVWLPLVFGSEFGPVVPVAILLLVAGTLKGLRLVIDRALRADGNTRSGMTGEAVALVVLVLAGIVGARFGGLTGLALAVIAAQAAGLAAVMLAAALHLECPASALVPLRHPSHSRLLAAFLRRLRS
jgi:O-antigen/teichoic acid export membrane protein